MKKQNGFTLVELAIVLMIIGLLIGGILKGQELIQNARINTFLRQFKAYDAAAITFQDSYGALPGDITNPSTRIPNCTTGQCTTAGNGDGQIANGTVYINDESNAFWLHLAAANLISGIDMNATWPSGDYWVATSPAPATPLGGVNYLHTYNWPTHAMFAQPIIGTYYAGGTKAGQNYSIPVNVLMKVDIKADDGRPWSGDFVLNGGGCNVTIRTGSYDANNNSLCGFVMKTSF